MHGKREVVGEPRKVVNKADFFFRFFIFCLQWNKLTVVRSIVQIKVISIFFSVKLYIQQYSTVDIGLVSLQNAFKWNFRN